MFIFLASGNYSHMNLGLENVGIFSSTTSHFWFGENPLGFEWGTHGFGDGIFFLALGIHTHKESLILRFNCGGDSMVNPKDCI